MIGAWAQAAAGGQTLVDLKYWLVIALVLLALVPVMVLVIRSAKKNRSLAGLLLTASMIFGGGTVQPPPRHATEDEDRERGQKQGDTPKAGRS